MSVDHARLRAEKAWSRYASVCAFGGTEQERTFAYQQASKAEQDLVVLERATAARPTTSARAPA